MYQIKSLNDTIAAISTPGGIGGIGIVRLSGKKAVSIADKMFISRSGKRLDQATSHTIHYGWIVRDLKSSQERIDEVLVTLMLAPRSYTKEDVVEISCHGGIVSQRAILSLAIKLGARFAEPGEFTKRAFLNGRIDLAQAEAVLDIIHAKTDAFLKLSTNQLKGELSAELEVIREQLMHIYVEMEAVLNFPEDEIDSQGRGKLFKDMEQCGKRIKKLLVSSEHGRILKEGIKIVLCGKPNVGKSSLLNVLLRQPRAIVSDIAGTTRDTIEESAQIMGIPLQLVDTAGILEPRDMIEQEAVKRSRMYMRSADLVLLILDASQGWTREDWNLSEGVKGQNVLIVVNKTDLKRQIKISHIKEVLGDVQIVEVSALEKAGIVSLEKAIIQNVWQSKTVNTHGLFVSNLRHIHALEDCDAILKKAQGFLKQELSLEFISEEIKAAVNCLDNITGRNIDADLLDNIFSQFCIGK